MTQQTRLQVIMEDLRKELGFDSAELNVYVSFMGKHKNNKQQSSQAITAYNPFEDDLRSVNVTAQVTKDNVEYSVETGRIRGEPGQLSEKALKQAVVLDKFGYAISKVLNVTED